jgi:hypothetical protein
VRRHKAIASVLAVLRVGAAVESSKEAHVGAMEVRESRSPVHVATIEDGEGCDIVRGQGVVVKSIQWLTSCLGLKEER